MKLNVNRIARETVPIVGAEYEDLVQTLTFLARRDTSVRLYQRLLTALRDMGSRASCVQISFEPHNYKPQKKVRRKARRP